MNLEVPGLRHRASHLKQAWLDLPSPALSLLAATWTVWLVALGIMLGYFLVYLDRVRVLLAYPFTIDQGEAYDAYSGWLINLGQWIYANNSVFPYYSSNYPPLYSYLISIPMTWLGPSIEVARAVSVLAAVGVGVLIGWVVYRSDSSLGHRPLLLAAVTSVLVFFASNYVFHTTPLARVNALTLFLSLAALAMLEQPSHHSAGRGRHPAAVVDLRLIGAALLFLAAMMSKQTAVDALAAGCLWLLFHGRWRSLLVLVAIVGGLGAVAVAGLEVLSGGHFWANVVVGNANPWEAGQALVYYENFARLHLVVLALALVQTLREVRSGRPSVFGFYLAAAAVWALSAGKWGAGESYFLATLAAACVQSGKLFSSVAQRGWPLLASTASNLGFGRSRDVVALLLVGLLLLVQAALFAHGPVAALFPGRIDSGFQAHALGWTPSDGDLAAGDKLLEYTSRWDGHILAEDAGFVMAAGKPIVGNATHLRNMWKAGIWDEADLVADIAERRFDYIILEAELFPEPVLEAVGRYYYLYDQAQISQRRYLVFAPGAS